MGAWVRTGNRDLAFHLVSEHHDPQAFSRLYVPNISAHHDDHQTAAQDHRPDDHSWDAEKLEAVLEEMEEDY